MMVIRSIISKSYHLFLIPLSTFTENFYQNLSIPLVILQTDRQTNQYCQKPVLPGGGTVNDLFIALIYLT